MTRSPTLSSILSSKPKSPGSIAGLKKYGVIRSSLQCSLINEFHLNEYAKQAVKKYYILYWSGKFTSQSNKEGLIFHEGINYCVVFHNCSAWKVRNAAQVKLSFRQAQDEFNLPAYVLISTTDSESITER